MDIGAWRATVHGVAKSQTRLRDEHFHFFRENLYHDYPLDGEMWHEIEGVEDVESDLELRKLVSENL